MYLVNYLTHNDWSMSSSMNFPHSILSVSNKNSTIFFPFRVSVVVFEFILGFFEEILFHYLFGRSFVIFEYIRTCIDVLIEKKFVKLVVFCKNFSYMMVLQRKDNFLNSWNSVECTRSTIPILWWFSGLLYN